MKRITLSLVFVIAVCMSSQAFAGQCSGDRCFRPVQRAVGVVQKTTDKAVAVVKKAPKMVRKTTKRVLRVRPVRRLLGRRCCR